MYSVLLLRCGCCYSSPAVLSIILLRLDGHFNFLFIFFSKKNFFLTIFSICYYIRLLFGWLWKVYIGICYKIGNVHIDLLGLRHGFRLRVFTQWRTIIVFCRMYFVGIQCKLETKWFRIVMPFYWKLLFPISLWKIR